MKIIFILGISFFHLLSGICANQNMSSRENYYNILQKTQVKLLTNTISGTYSSCYGTVISKNQILTARYCVTMEGPETRNLISINIVGANFTTKAKKSNYIFDQFKTRGTLAIEFETQALIAGDKGEQDLMKENQRFQLQALFSDMAIIETKDEIPFDLDLISNANEEITTDKARAKISVTT